MPRLLFQMTLFKDKFRIESARHPRWSYSDPAWYFVTICTENRDSYLGRIEAAEVHLFPAGLIAQACWKQIPEHFPQAEIDHFVVMPNHLHGIVAIGPSEKPATLGTIVGSFKSAATRRCRREGLPLAWQTRFHDRIIRGNKALGAIRDYILANPRNWMEDEYFV